MGRFIVIDGLDGSGKETQAKLLCEALEKKNVKVRYLSFPCYENESSFAVKLYLSGGLGGNPSDTNAYAASSFFAVDRYISYRTDWEKDYKAEDTVVIANRYTTANAVHQLSKLPTDVWDDYLPWLWDFEFNRLGLPKPDDVIYLEMTPEISRNLIKARSEKTGREMDIHETNATFLDDSYRAAMYASDKLGWKRIRCYADGSPRTREDIHDEIMKILGL